MPGSTVDVELDLGENIWIFIVILTSICLTMLLCCFLHIWSLHNIDWVGSFMRGGPHKKNHENERIMMWFWRSSLLVGREWPESHKWGQSAKGENVLNPTWKNPFRFSQDARASSTATYYCVVVVIVAIKSSSPIIFRLSSAPWLLPIPFPDKPHLKRHAHSLTGWHHLILYNARL